MASNIAGKVLLRYVSTVLYDKQYCKVQYSTVQYKC